MQTWRNYTFIIYFLNQHPVVLPAISQCCFGALLSSSKATCTEHPVSLARRERKFDLNNLIFPQSWNIHQERFRRIPQRVGFKVSGPAFGGKYMLLLSLELGGCLVILCHVVYLVAVGLLIPPPTVDCLQFVPGIFYVYRHAHRRQGLLGVPVAHTSF